MALADEFKTIELGDPRLNRRAVLLAERLGQKPSASAARRSSKNSGFSTFKMLGTLV